MKMQVTHASSPHRHAPLFHWSAGHLVNQRARLRVLIYTMEHDQSIQAQPWQIQSLKRLLDDIEQRIGPPSVRQTSYRSQEKA
jgi:hypothetical protein